MMSCLSQLTIFYVAGPTMTPAQTGEQDQVFLEEGVHMRIMGESIYLQKRYVYIALQRRILFNSFSRLLYFIGSFYDPK